ncbi:MAG: 3-hydroxyacyl-ACP dehydratase [Deltaproteobacteria bacterium]|nr:3-hydroxyacyl-ACP dehydratase [Deltaproteobacteria bacterium]
MSAPLTLPMDAADLIPQREPMRFVDRLVSYRDREAETEALVAPDNPMLDAQGRLEGPALLELLAQACAASRGYEDAVGGGSVKVGFLVGSRRFRATGTARAGDRLVIHTKTVGAFEGFSIVDGEIRRGGETIATGTLKLWVADGPPAAEPGT